MKNTKIINRLIDYYLEGSELTQDEHNTVRSLKEEMQAINYTHSCKSDSEQLQGFFDYYKKKFGNGFSTDVLEITLKKYKETL